MLTDTKLLGASSRRMSLRYGISQLTERQGLLVLVLAAYAGTFVLIANGTAPDTWLAILGGREVAHHGLPSVDHLTVLGHGGRWVDQQWLAQLIFYGAYHAGGLVRRDALECVIRLCRCRRSSDSRTMARRRHAHNGVDRRSGDGAVCLACQRATRTDPRLPPLRWRRVALDQGQPPSGVERPTRAAASRAVVEPAWIGADRGLARCASWALDNPPADPGRGWSRARRIAQHVCVAVRNEPPALLRVDALQSGVQAAQRVGADDAKARDRASVRAPLCRGVSLRPGRAPVHGDRKDGHRRDIGCGPPRGPVHGVVRTGGVDGPPAASFERCSRLTRRRSTSTAYAEGLGSRRSSA